MRARHEVLHLCSRSHAPVAACVTSVAPAAAMPPPPPTSAHGTGLLCFQLCQWPQLHSHHPFPSSLPPYKGRGSCCGCSLGTLTILSFFRVSHTFTPTSYVQSPLLNLSRGVDPPDGVTEVVEAEVQAGLIPRGPWRPWEGCGFHSRCRGAQEAGQLGAMCAEWRLAEVGSSEGSRG